MKVDISENLYQRMWSFIDEFDKEGEAATKAGIHQGIPWDRPLRQQFVADRLLGESGHIIRQIKELFEESKEQA